MNNIVQKSRHFTMQELATGIYAAIATDGAWAICNAGIIDLGHETVIFDTFVNQIPARELKEVAQEVTPGAIRYVVNSHWHGDHVRGNQVFDGSKIVATSKTREVMLQRKRAIESDPESIRRDAQTELEAVLSNPMDPDAKLQEGYMRGILDGLPSLSYVLPEITFESELTIHGSKRNVEVITYGGGHTLSDAFLHVPEDRVLFLGDLLFINSHPYLLDGEPDELLRILDRVEQLDAKILVPGHGRVGSPDDIRSFRDYLVDLEKSVDHELASGASPDAIPRMDRLSKYQEWKWRNFCKENFDFLFERKSRKNK
jgi:cyclase